MVTSKSEIDVIILCCGARTAVGSTAATTAAAVNSGIQRLREHPRWVDQDGNPMVFASDPSIDPELYGAARFSALIDTPLKEAVLPLVGRRQVPVPLLLALPEPRPGLPVALTQAMNDAITRVQLKDICIGEIDVFSSGNAAGHLALQECILRLERNESSYCIIGGVDSYWSAETLEWLDSTEQLHSERNRFGFVPGEAAAFCLLASHSALKGPKEPYLHINRVSLAHEKSLLRTNDICTGRGLSDALLGALAGLPTNAAVQEIFCDLNGEPYRTDEYGFSIPRIAPLVADPTDYCAPATSLGSVGAASAPLLLALANAISRRGRLRGDHSLVWCSSESGLRGAVTLMKKR